MSNTSRHIIAAAGWLFGLPFFAVVLYTSSALPSSPLHWAVISVVWGIGLVAIFCSWALRDAPIYGKSRNVALAFTAAWLLVFALAVFPYLFFTRGAKGGSVAALKFVALCLSFAIVWVAVPRLFSSFF